MNVGDRVATRGTGATIGFPNSNECLHGSVVSVDPILIQWDGTEFRTIHNPVKYVIDAFDSGLIYVELPTKLRKKIDDPPDFHPPRDDDPRDNPLEDFMPGGAWYPWSTVEIA